MSVVSQLLNTAVCFVFHNNNQTDQGDDTEGLEREGLLEGERLEMDHLFFKPNLSNIRFTVPSAVALLNYRMCGTFPKQGSLAGFLHNFAGRISEAAMSGAGCAQRPVLPVNKPKKTGERSAKKRTRGINSIVEIWAAKHRYKKRLGPLSIVTGG